EKSKDAWDHVPRWTSCGSDAQKVWALQQTASDFLHSPGSTDQVFTPDLAPCTGENCWRMRECRARKRLQFECLHDVNRLQLPCHAAKNTRLEIWRSVLLRTGWGGGVRLSFSFATFGAWVLVLALADDRATQGQPPVMGSFLHL